MQKSTPERDISLAIKICKVKSDNDLTYYKLSTQYSDELLVTSSSYSVTSSDVLLNMINLAESTFCKRILILVENDEELRENLKVLSGQSASKTKAKVLDKIAYNKNERTKLNSLFRVVNIEIL